MQSRMRTMEARREMKCLSLKKSVIEFGVERNSSGRSATGASQLRAIQLLRVSE
jgi:hypothetical protein